MEISNNLRVATINKVKGEQISDKDKKIVKEFLIYLDAFCADLNYTQYDILLNDENYNIVFGLFEDIILNKTK